MNRHTTFFDDSFSRLALPVFVTFFAIGCAINFETEPQRFLFPLLLPCAILLVVVLALGFAFERLTVLRKAIVFFPLLYILSAMVGYINADIHRPELTPHHVTHSLTIGKHYTAQLKICSGPTTTPKRRRYEAQFIGYIPQDTLIPICGHTNFFAYQDMTLSKGDVILADIRLEEPQNTGDYDYKRDLRRKGIYYNTFLNGPRYCLLDNKATRFQKALDTVRYRLDQSLQTSSLTADQLGIARAMVLGNRKATTERIETLFRSAGITHLLCVSGLHVGIIAGFFAFLFKPLRFRRKTKHLSAALQLLLLWSFVLLTGSAPATLRAGLMCSFLIIGQCLFKQYSSVTAIALSALMLLIFRPTLIADIGFQLSYAAVAGIIAFTSPTNYLIKKAASNLIEKSKKKSYAGWVNILRHILFRIAQLVVLSTAAQLATLPIILYNIHQFPPYFLIANLLVVPFAGVLLFSIFLMMIFVWAPPIYGIATHIVSFLLQLVERLTTWIAGLPHALIQDIPFYIPQAVALSIFVVVLAIAIRKASFRMRA